MNLHYKISAGWPLAILLFLFPLCGNAQLCFCMKSLDPKAPFTLKITLPQENWKTGTVQYKGSSEIIMISAIGNEELEHYEGRPSYIKYSWAEHYRGKITGTYVLCIQGARIYDSWYFRKRDRKKYKLEQLMGFESCSECFTSEDP